LALVANAGSTDKASTSGTSNRDFNLEDPQPRWQRPELPDNAPVLQSSVVALAGDGSA